MKAENEVRLSEIEKRLTLCEVANQRGDVKKSIEEEVRKSSEKDSEELALIKSKEQNLVYFNIPEKDDESIAERMKHDYKILCEAYDQNIDNKEISSIFRVGKKDDNRARPLVVKFATVDIKNKILKKSGDLKIKRGNENLSVYVSIDRTKDQREKHRKLVEELKKRRRETGDLNLVIRGEKIVQNFPRETGAQRITWASLFR